MISLFPRTFLAQQRLIFLRRSRSRTDCPSSISSNDRTSSRKLAEVRDAQHRPSEAEKLLKERILILERRSSLSGLMTGIAWFDLETHYAVSGQLDPSVESARSATSYYSIHMTDPTSMRSDRSSGYPTSKEDQPFQRKPYCSSAPWRNVVPAPAISGGTNAPSFMQAGSTKQSRSHGMYSSMVHARWAIERCT